MPRKPKAWKTPVAVERSAEWLRRSKASRKGWQKRKKRELPKKISREQKLSDNAKVIRGKSNPRIENEFAGKTVKQLQKMYHEAKRDREFAEEKLRVEIMTKDWVPTHEKSMLRENYSIALEPSRLRHNVDTEELKQKLNDASGGNFGVQAMDLTRGQRRRLRRTAEEIAENYDVSVREVYTLFYSP